MNMMKSLAFGLKAALASFSLLAVSLAFFVPANAQTAQPKDLTSGPSITTVRTSILGAARGSNIPTYGGQALDQIVLNVLRYLLGFVGIVAFAFVLYGGFAWMTAGGNADQVSTARSTVITAAAGVVLIGLSFSLVGFIGTSIDAIYQGAQNAPQGGLIQKSAGLVAGEYLKAPDARTLFLRVVQYVLGFVGLIAFVFVLYGGVRWMTSLGNETAITEAQTIIRNASVGIVVILFAFTLTTAGFTFLTKMSQSVQESDQLQANISQLAANGIMPPKGQPTAPLAGISVTVTPVSTGKLTGYVGDPCDGPFDDYSCVPGNTCKLMTGDCPWYFFTACTGREYLCFGNVQLPSDVANERNRIGLCEFDSQCSKNPGDGAKCDKTTMYEDKYGICVESDQQGFKKLIGDPCVDNNECINGFCGFDSSDGTKRVCMDNSEFKPLNLPAGSTCANNSDCVSNLCFPSATNSDIKVCAD